MCFFRATPPVYHSYRSWLIPKSHLVVVFLGQTDLVVVAVMNKAILVVVASAAVEDGFVAAALFHQSADCQCSVRFWYDCS